MIDIEEVTRVLVTLGIDEASARAQLVAAENDTERLAEAALLAVESDAAVLISDDMPLPVALFELVDGLRQAGLALALGETEHAELALALETPRPSFYEVVIGDGATPRDMVRAVANIVPRSHHVLLASEYEQPGVLPVVILERGNYVSFSAAVGDGALERVLLRASSEPGRVTCRAAEGPLSLPNFVARYDAYPPLEAASVLDAVFERVRTYDPRVPWPAGRTRPPGDDFYDLCSALAAAPLARCLAASEAKPLAQLVFRFALASLVGAQCDMLAARRNPGLSAQGLLGWGQLTWAYFIFEALGARKEADQAGALLEQPWVMEQERGSVALRQRAYHDLARWFHTGTRGPTLGCVAELLTLTDRAAWENADRVAAALAVHTEPRGDQLTHHPLYYAWPAPLYALARRADATDLLPIDNPFLARPLSYALVDQHDPLITRLREQLARFSALDPERLPPLLDPLPVIVDVAITHVDGEEVHGHTLLAAHDEAEHRVVAPHAGRDIRPGEVWLLEVQGSVRKTRQEQLPDLGAVSCTIALPTGEWLEKA